MARTYNVIDADGHVLEPVDTCSRSTWTRPIATGPRG